MPIHAHTFHTCPHLHRRAMQAMSADQGPSLGQVLRPEVLAPLLSEPGTVERLAEHLPSEHRNQVGVCEDGNID